MAILFWNIIHWSRHIWWFLLSYGIIWNYLNWLYQLFFTLCCVFRELRHPNLVHLLGVTNDKDTGNIHIVTEFLSKGNLVDYLRTRGRSVITKVDQIGFTWWVTFITSTLIMMNYKIVYQVLHCQFSWWRWNLFTLCSYMYVSRRGDILRLLDILGVGFWYVYTIRNVEVWKFVVWMMLLATCSSFALALRIHVSGNMFSIFIFQNFYCSDVVRGMAYIEGKKLVHREIGRASCRERV